MRNPILMGGERYTKAVKKPRGGSGKEYGRSYDDSRINLISNVKTILGSIDKGSEVFLGNKTYCIRLDPGFEAKSYTPESLFKIDDVRMVGGRKYRTVKNDADADAKLYFAKGTERGLNNLLGALSSDSNVSDRWKKEIRSINRIDFLTEQEKTSGFPPEWEEGPVEIVLHPEISKEENELESLIECLGINERECASKNYEGGPIFCSARCSREQLSSLSKLNYVRAIHPIEYEGIEFRQSSVKQIIFNHEFSGKPSTTIGIFDGGVNINHPVLKRYVNSYDLTELDPVPDAVEHGTAVCSAAIFGSIGDQMPEPNVCVNLYRIHPMPRNDAYSPLELYEVIDKIEETIEKKGASENIYSVSFGPRGSIIDDEISRFTYALDRLSVLERKPLFCVAAGNTGDLACPVNRIHAPADMMNGISVGAYAHGPLGFPVVADYSSCGPGREGCKIKPDVLEFGGSEKDPVILLSADPDVLVGRHGTSFSAPILAGKIGKMLSESDDLDAHMARTLIIHTAEKEPGSETKRVGHGICKASLDDILSCSNNYVTTTYKGQIKRSGYMRLDILIPFAAHLKDAMVDISWTIICISRPDHKDVDSYTGNCIEDTFYPHEDVFNYRKDKMTKSATAGSEKEKDLLSDGFVRSKYPKSKTPEHAANESDMRRLDFKWDTVVKKQIRINAKNLKNPHLVLHANTRDKDRAPTEYYAAVSIGIHNYRGNLYTETVREYTQITPMRLRNVGRIDIKT